MTQCDYCMAHVFPHSLLLYPEPAVTFTPSYKKTPPPVPPRSVTKPLISVTAQSSTESMQDAYQEGRLPRLPRSRDIWGKYVSTESLDSAKALTLATEGRRLVSTGSYTSVQTCDKAVLVSKAEEYLKTPRSSIGIQVYKLHFYSFIIVTVTPSIKIYTIQYDEISNHQGHSVTHRIIHNYKIHKVTENVVHCVRGPDISFFLGCAVFHYTMSH